MGGAYTYDEVGNTLTGNGRTFTWNSQNLPVSIAGPLTTGGGSGTPTPTATSGSTSIACPTLPAGTTPAAVAYRGGPTVPGTVTPVAYRGCVTGGGSSGGGGGGGGGMTVMGTETYTYDAEGTRVSRASQGITTLYFFGLWEQDKETGTTRAYYALGSSTVAQRTRVGGMGTGTVVYLHGDHLGSVTLTTGDNAAKVSGEEYDAWGKVRGGDNSATTPVDFTGQHRDATNLLYYGARYYDPALGRFLSADTLVKGQVMGRATGDGRQFDIGAPNSQALNRYAYVENNPVNNVDPTGHTTYEEAFVQQFIAIHPG